MHIQTEICRIARPAYVRAGAAPRLLVKDSCPGGTRDGKTPPDRRCRPDQENVSTTIPQVQRSDVVDRVRTAIEFRGCADIGTTTTFGTAAPACSELAGPRQ